MANITKLNGYDIKDSVAREDLASLTNLESSHYNTLSGSITDLNEELTDKYEELTLEDSSLSDRIDAIASLPEGSTSGDAELIDARTIDGVTFSSLGNGLRTEFDLVNNDIDNILYKDKNNQTPALVNGFVKYTDYTISDNSFDGAYKRTTYIEIPIGTVKITNNFRYNGSAGYVFFKANKVAISGGNNLNEITTIPANAKYIMFSDYELSGNHTNRYYNMVSDFASNKELKKSVDDLNESILYLKNGTIELTPELLDGFVDTRTNTINNNGFDGFYKRTNYIEIPLATNKILHNFNCSNNCGYIFVNDSYTVISGGNTLNEISTIPENAKYIMISDYDNSKLHANKYITFVCTPSLYSLENEISELGGRTCDINNLVTYGDSHVARGLWQNAVINYFGIINHTNLGVGSSTVAINSSATVAPFVDSNRIDGIKNANPDTIIIIGGTNDVNLETPMGSVSELSASLGSKNKSTFYGAYSYLIETLLEWKPSLKIIIATTPQGYYDVLHPTSYEQISAIIRNIANYYSLPVMDIFGKCGINKTNLSTYSDDLIHYNTLGNKRVSKLAIDTINNSYIKYKDSDI